MTRFLCSRASQIALVALMVPMMMASEDQKGCKNCRGDTPGLDDTDGEVVEGDGTDIDVDVELQTVAIRPSVIEPAEVVEAQIFGAGFVEGATVSINEIELDNVAFMNDNTLGVTVPPLAPGLYDVTVTNLDLLSSTLFKGLTVQQPDTADCRHVRLFFELDKASLGEEARKLLDGKTACYQESRGTINIHGHADERGTTDYNLALGQRRADTVQRHLANHGVGPSRINTVSYGEERPLEQAHTESAWSKNRRAEVYLLE
jgi:peptidoglycan-associated lipoprotein